MSVEDVGEERVDRLRLVAPARAHGRQRPVGLLEDLVEVAEDLLEPLAVALAALVELVAHLLQLLLDVVAKLVGALLDVVARVLHVVAPAAGEGEDAGEEEQGRRGGARAEATGHVGRETSGRGGTVGWSREPEDASACIRASASTRRRPVGRGRWRRRSRAFGRPRADRHGFLPTGLHRAAGRRVSSCSRWRRARTPERDRGRSSFATSSRRRASSASCARTGRCS